MTQDKTVPKGGLEYAVLAFPDENQNEASSSMLTTRSAPRLNPRRVSENNMCSTPLTSRRSRPQLNGLRRTRSTGELQDPQSANKKYDFRLPRDFIRHLKVWKNRPTKEESTHMQMDFGPPKQSTGNKSTGGLRAQIRSSVIFVSTFVRSVFDR